MMTLDFRPLGTETNLLTSYHHEVPPIGSMAVLNGDPVPMRIAAVEPRGDDTFIVRVTGPFG